MVGTVSKKTEFECMYILISGDKWDFNFHRYSIDVTVDAPQRYTDSGEIIRFEKLGEYLNSVVPDNEMLVPTSFSDSDFISVVSKMSLHGLKLRAMDFDICAEGLCNYIAKTLQERLNQYEPGCRVVEVKLRENSSSYVSWHM